jgi:hypothetical protein
MDLFELVFANESVDNATISTQVIMYNQCCSSQISESDCNIHIKLNYNGYKITGQLHKGIIILNKQTYHTVNAKWWD